jgi:hypothetical protein
MLDHKIIDEIAEKAKISELFIDYKRNQLISEANFLDWAENEAKTDAGIPEVKLKIKHRQLKKNTLGLYLGQNKMAIKRTMVEQKDHFDYLETLRHEIEHYRFEKRGYEKALYKKLKSQTKVMAKEIYHQLDRELKKLYLGVVLEEEFEKTRKGSTKLKILMIVKIIDESLAYWHEIRFLQKIVNQFLIQKKIPAFFQARPIVEEKNLDHGRMSLADKLKLSKLKKTILDNTLIERNIVIEIILSVFKAHSDLDFYEFLWRLYEEQEYPQPKEIKIQTLFPILP